MKLTLPNTVIKYCEQTYCLEIQYWRNFQPVSNKRATFLGSVENGKGNFQIPYI